MAEEEGGGEFGGVVMSIVSSGRGSLKGGSGIVTLRLEAEAEYYWAEA